MPNARVAEPMIRPQESGQDESQAMTSKLPDPEPPPPGHVPDPLPADEPSTYETGVNLEPPDPSMAEAGVTPLQAVPDGESRPTDTGAEAPTTPAASPATLATPVTAATPVTPVTAVNTATATTTAAVTVAPPGTGDPFAVRDALRTGTWLRRILNYAALSFVVLAVLGVALAFHEGATSRFQARYFARIASQMHFNVEPGPSDRIRFPASGPFDARRGYVDLPAFTASLRAKGYRVESQARFSRKMIEVTDKGIFPIYREKTQTGLRLLDDRGQAMFVVNYPLKVYPTFDSIPDQVVKTLLFIENRTLLDSSAPNHNPAVEWSRLGKAVVELVRQKLGKPGNVAGGSTLATQLEKYRHSGDGITLGPKDKLSQMLAASLRTYQQGENTIEARKRILLDYVNTVPLAALPGYGEVNGLSDGMLAWYGSSLDSVNRQLKVPRSRGAGPTGLDSGVDMVSVGKGYRQVLNLFIAHRRPSSYLLQHRDALQSIGENYIRILGREGVITPQLRDAGLVAQPELMRRAAAFFPAAFVERKHVNAVRNRLTNMLGLPRLYDLDRLDLTVNTTLDGKVQKAVVNTLRRLADSTYVDSVGLHAFRLLERGDPSKVIYSFTLYETVGGRNLLRVQADNYEQPLNINEGVKLDLGSTAKLRTLVNYLEILTDIHARIGGKTAQELKALSDKGPDPLTRWAAGQMASASPGDTSRAALLALLDAAMDRKYSGSPKEKFFTGGGIHTFVNFDPGEDHVMPVREAFRHSVNLVFIRMMRDIVHYYTAQGPVSRAALLDSGDSPERQKYLAKFAEQEGQVFLGRFFRKYRGKQPDEVMELFFHGIRRTPKRLATAYLVLEPKADTAAYLAFMRAQLADSLYPQKPLEALYRAHFKENLGFTDLAYVAGVHPMEMWLAGFLRAHPQAHWSQVKEAGRQQIQETYTWLFKTRHKQAQDTRIRSMMEMEAFLEIHRAWARLGYPFGSLVPSYASSIGSSADRPNALAELVGILLNDGVRHPPVMINRLHFAENTPFETVLTHADTVSRRLLAPEICKVAREALLDIVENGTAVRGRRAFPVAGGGWLPLGGKTGTGDQRFETFGPGGQVLESRVVNRTATFVFYLGDRFFGTITAHVHGEQAADYGFTSSLPVALLKLMGPDLMPLLMNVRDPGAPTGTLLAEKDGGRRSLSVPGGFVAPRGIPGLPGQSVPVGNPSAGTARTPSRQGGLEMPPPAPSIRPPNQGAGDTSLLPLAP